MSIQQLPPHIAHHIAAGEVIDRPVSVLKELIENSLDAQATSIEIVIEQSGLSLIKVVDNGTGIVQADAKLIFERYSTSKISSIKDLYSLSSLGFRGEALFSIMSVANVVMKTRHVSESFGSQIETFKGRVESILPVGMRVGTTVEVRDLFLQYPVRLQHVDIKNERKMIKKLVESFALFHTKVGFSLTINNKNIIHTFKDEDILSRAESIWKLLPHQQISFSSNYMHGSLSGIMSKPEFFAIINSQQLLFVNQRHIISQALQQTIDKALQNFNHHSKYPRYILSLSINPHIIDINIHPQKKQIQILHEQELLDNIYDTVQSIFHSTSTSQVRYTASSIFPNSALNLHDASDNTFHIFGTIQQFDQTYLLAITSKGLLLVDQHAADERLWYNKLKNNSKLLDKISTQLTRECVQELDDDIYQHSFESKIDSTIATIACHQAIRAGQSLSQTEARELIENTIAGGTETLVCPHGRPTYMFISKQQLDSSFRRT